MYKYKKVVLDFETTGLDADCNEILQVSAIDQDGNTLINEYCKPEFTTEWHEAEQIHGISPSAVKNKKHFKEYVEKLSDILSSTEQIIIYNAEFEISFLKKYKVKFNKNIYDLMLKFASIYGEWNSYWESYTWQKLSVCCSYYGYYLGNAHDSLEDCKATLYCYYKVINKENKYDAKEYVGITVREFISQALKRVNNTSILLTLYPKEYENKREIRYNPFYFHGKVEDINDIKNEELLNCKIKKINYKSLKRFSACVENFLQGDFNRLERKIEIMTTEKEKLKEEIKYLHERIYDKSTLYSKSMDKIIKLEKENKKLKEKLGLIPKEKKKIPMYNQYGYYTADYCRSTRKPMIQKSEYDAFKNVLLSKTRCKQIKEPVREGEEIYAFLRVMHGYCALYFRNTKEL